MILIVSTSKALRAESYYSSKLRQIISEKSVFEGNVVITVIPLTEELTAAKVYAKMSKEGHSRQEIREEIKKKTQKTQKEKKLIAILTVKFTGDSLSQAPAAISLPEDLSKYIFVENDRSNFVPCKIARPPMEKVDSDQRSAVIPLVFHTEYQKGKKEHNILEDTEYIEFVVGGLGFSNNRIRYDIPLSDLCKDAPQDTKSLWEEERDNSSF